MSDSEQTSTLDPVARPVAPQPARSRPSFLEGVLGMPTVIAVALASLVIGGLSGFVLGEHTSGSDDRFGRGGFPGGQPLPGGPQGMGGQQPFGQSQTTP